MYYGGKPTDSPSPPGSEMYLKLLLLVVVVHWGGREKKYIMHGNSAICSIVMMMLSEIHFHPIQS